MSQRDEAGDSRIKTRTDHQASKKSVERKEKKRHRWSRRVKKHPQEPLAFLHDASELGSVEGDDDDDDTSGDVPANRCVQQLQNAIKSFMPGYTPVFMYMTLVFVAFLAAFVRASEGNQPTLAFYGIYLGISLIIILLPLLARVTWIFFFGRGLILISDRLVAALAAVLDPESTYLVFTLLLAVFWSNAITAVDPGRDDGVVEYYLLRNRHWTFVAPSDDITLFFRIEVLLIIWASKNLIVSVIMFYFLLGLVMNVNSSLVKFLSIYSLMRKLNANWIRLTPIITEISNPYPAIVTSDEEDKASFLDYRRNISFPPRGNNANKGDTGVTSFTQGNFIEGPSQGPDLKIPAPSGSSAKIEAVLEEILAVEAEERCSRSAVSPSGLGATLQRLNSSTQMVKRMRKKDLRERYNVDFLGRSLPPFMRRKNIQKTQTDALANLLAINFVRSSPVILFVRGTPIKLHSKKLAKLVGKRLFEELIEFRNSVAPHDQDLSTQQLDKLVKQTVIQTVETTMQKAESISTKICSANGSTEYILQSSAPGGLVAREQSKSMSLALEFASERGTSIEPPVERRLEEIGRTQATGTNSSAEGPLPVKSHSREAQNWGDAEPNSPYSITVSRTQTSRAVIGSKNGQQHLPLLEDKSKRPRSEQNSLVHPISLERNSEEDESQKDIQATKKPSARVTWEAKTHGEPLPVGDVAGPAVHFLRVKPKVEEDERKLLTRELFELFLGDQVDEFMRCADPGGRGLVSRREFVRMTIEIYELRKKLVELVDSQEGIRSVFRRMVSLFLTFVALLIFLGFVGISVNTLVISGAASISSITVALSFLYSGFIQSVLFVCFLNPYNVGDRVQLEGAMHVVKKISTYFTEFSQVHGKPVFWNHSTLYGMKIMNESRNRNAGLEIPIIIAFDTPPSKYEALHKVVHTFVQENADFVKDSCTCIMGDVVIGHYIKFTYWITVVESWHNWKSVWASRARLMKTIIRHCRESNITYRLPVQPIHGTLEPLHEG